MVLDYNKINRMKRSTSCSSVGSSTSSDPLEPKLADKENESLHVTDQNCDIAFITEEVIDGALVGVSIFCFY